MTTSRASALGLVVGGCYEFAVLLSASLDAAAQSLSHASRDSSLYTRELGVNPSPHHCEVDFTVYGLPIGAVWRVFIPALQRGAFYRSHFPQSLYASRRLFWLSDKKVSIVLDNPEEACYTVFTRIRNTQESGDFLCRK